MYKQDILKEIKRVNKQNELILKRGTIIGRFGVKFGILDEEDRKLFLGLQPECYVKHICKDFKDYFAKLNIDVDAPENDEKMIDGIFSIYKSGYFQGFAYNSNVYLNFMAGDGKIFDTKEDALKNIERLVSLVQKRDVKANKKFFGQFNDEQRNMLLMVLRDGVRNGANAATKIISKSLNFKIKWVSPQINK